MFYGRGAGGHPTAAMMLGDTIDAANAVVTGTHRGVGPLPDAAIVSIDDVDSAFYLSVDAVDEPGVLGEIAGAFGERGVSIKSMEQDTGGEDFARIIFITHAATERNLRATLAELGDLPSVKNIGQVLRVIGG